ncbi:hypothetical protein [Pseudoalteromonas sp. Z9A5]|uniref:hypothetical protein n=1 Tax=Pseudoalteromonas sp. Z9A5 TaxID=2686355 RepID=UPI00140A1322|nr:hypothetical protein [Pseudoalteromonas sp. Z9A5]
MDTLESSWTPILALLIPLLYVIFSVMKKMTAKSIFKYGVPICILSGIFIEVIVQSHPHVPAFMAILLTLLYFLIIVIFTVFIRSLYRTFTSKKVNVRV